MDYTICAYCGKPHNQPTGAVNRAIKRGLRVYCNRVCAGLGRRTGKTVEQKKEEKRLYDLQYRVTSPTPKVRKAAYYQRTHDPAKEAEKRKERMPKHLEYCRRPEYREWKRKYDQQYLARKQYGEFGEAVLLLREIEQEVTDRTEDRFQLYALKGTLNKKLKRRREYEQYQSKGTDSR